MVEQCSPKLCCATRFFCGARKEGRVISNAVMHYSASAPSVAVFGNSVKNLHL